MELISRADYARRRGVSRAAVTQAVKAGRIQLVDGRIDPAQADVAWERNTDPAQSERANAPKGGLRPGSREASVPVTAPHSGTEFQSVRTRRELAEAELAELRLAEQRGELVDKAGVERAARSAARLVRDRLLSVPPRVATELAVLTEPREIETRLRSELNRALDELSRLVQAGPPADLPN